jgi:hypothetical protein
MAFKNAGPNDTYTEFNEAEKRKRSDANDGHGMTVRILRGNRPNQVRMPSGRVISAGGFLLEQALKNGGVVIDKPLEADNGYDEGSVVTLNPNKAKELIAAGQAEAV